MVGILAVMIAYGGMMLSERMRTKVTRYMRVSNPGPSAIAYTRMNENT